MIGATGAYGTSPMVNQLTQDKVLESDFVLRSHVFEAEERFSPSQLFIKGNFSQIYFIKYDDQYRIIYKGQITYLGPLFGESAACPTRELERVYYGRTAIMGIRFTKGIFTQPLCPKENKILANEPIGTYFIQQTATEWRIYVKTGENKINKVVIGAHSHEKTSDLRITIQLNRFDFDQAMMQMYFADFNNYFNNSADNIYQEIDRCIENMLKVFSYKPYSLQVFAGKLRICQTFMDLSFASGLSTPCFKKNLQSLTLDSLKSVDEVYFNFENKILHLNNFIELLIHLGKIGRTDLKFVHDSQLSFPGKRNQFCFEVIQRMRQELQGAELEWTIDCFLSHIFAGTPSPETKLDLQPLDISWQPFYNNMEKEPTIKVMLPHSKEVIFAHKTHLAKISKIFDGCLFNKECTEFRFASQYSDNAVRQFLHLAYGITPDFTNIDPDELIHLANNLDSSILLNYVNAYFDQNPTKITPNILTKLIEKNLWQLLPSKKCFFTYVGTQWRQIMQDIPESKRNQFREDFMMAWSKYL